MTSALPTTRAVTGASEPSVRRRLLEATARLVYRHGIAATGVEAIVLEAGVAKMSLYRTFPRGKDQLVAAALADQSERAVEHLVDTATAKVGDAAANDPLAVVLAIFDVIDDRARRPGWRGCPFLNAAAELPADHPGREIVLAHRHRLRHRLMELLSAAGIAEATVEGLGHSLLLVIDGALVGAGLMPHDRPAFVARQIAASLLRPQRTGAGADSDHVSATESQSSGRR